MVAARDDHELRARRAPGELALEWTVATGAPSYDLHVGTMGFLWTSRAYDHAREWPGVSFPDSPTPPDGCDAAGGPTTRARIAGLEVSAEDEAAFERADAELFPLVRGIFGGEITLAISGAAPIAPEILRFFYACGVPVMEGWGMTETSPVTHVNPIERNKPGTVGVLLPSTEARIVDLDSDEEVAAGDRGELCVRGPQIMKGYLNNQSATDAMIDPDGWLHTGDVAVVDDEGYFSIVDRVKELIKYKGFQVPPAELEALLLEHPDISDAAVVGRPDEEAGEIPVAFVVADGLEPDAVLAWVAERVAPYKKLRGIEMVDEIPKSASGKILRRELIERMRDA